jgi:hypothetical protein
MQLAGAPSIVTTRVHEHKLKWEIHSRARAEVRRGGGAIVMKEGGRRRRNSSYGMGVVYGGFGSWGFFMKHMT